MHVYACICMVGGGWMWMDDYGPRQLFLALRCLRKIKLIHGQSPGSWANSATILSLHISVRWFEAGQCDFGNALGYGMVFFAFLRWLPWLDLDCWQSSMKYITAEKVAKPGWLPLKWSWETWWQDHHSQIRSAVAWAMLQYASSGVWLRSWWLWARQRSNCATLVLLWTWGRPLKLRTYSLVSTGRLKWSLEQGILTVVMLSYDES